MDEQLLRITAARADLTAESPKTRARSLKVTAYNGGAMKVDRYFEPVVIDLKGLDVGSSERPILYAHDDSALDAVIGQTQKVAVEGGKVIATGKIFPVTPTAQQVVALADAGFQFQASVGLNVLSREFVNPGANVSVNGQTFSGPINVVRRSSLTEISVVALGADDKTAASIAASRKANMDTITTAAPAATISGDGSSGDNEPLKAERKAAFADIIAQHKAACPLAADQADVILTSALAGDWSTARLNAAVDQNRELHQLRASRSTSPTVNPAHRDSPNLAAVMTAALSMQCGVSGETLEKSGMDKLVIDAATTGQFRGATMHTILRGAVEACGMSSNLSAASLVLKAVECHERLRAGGTYSTYSIPGILGTAVNKIALQAFDGFDSSWRAISSRKPVSNFKATSTYALGGDLEFAQVPPGGELKHGTVGETAYTNKADAFGRILGIAFQDLVNDDLGLLDSLGRKIGRGASLKFNRVFWTEFLADHTSGATFFPTNGSKGNYISGATPGVGTDSRMNIDGLTNAETKFFEQTDPDGNPLGVIPRILLVPNGLNAIASNLMRSTEIRDLTGGSIPISNPHTGKFDVVRSTYLSNSAMGGAYSDAAWYLLAAPTDLPFIETVFLNGVESPTVESSDLDFNKLGLAIRGYHCFGVNKQEHRAAVKSKGAA